MCIQWVIKGKSDKCNQFAHLSIMHCKLLDNVLDPDLREGPEGDGNGLMLERTWQTVAALLPLHR